MVRAIIVINVIVFIVQSMNEGYKTQIWEYCSLYYFTSEKFYPFQLVTSMFVHADIGHIFSNMLGLFFLGPILEKFWGEKKFLFFYFFTGIGAGIFYMGLKYYDYHHLELLANNFIENPIMVNFQKFITTYYSENQIDSSVYSQATPQDLIQLKPQIKELLNSTLNTPLMGASGAGFGIMAAFALLFPNTELMLMFIPFPIKAKYLVTFYALYEIYSGLHKMPGDNVAHFAHIGGMIFAFILIKIWGRDRQSFY